MLWSTSSWEASGWNRYAKSGHSSHLDHRALQKGEVLTIGNAPKVVELWIAIEDGTIREAVHEEIIRYYPEIFMWRFFQKKRDLKQNPLNESKWVPVGQWTYDIWAAENV